MEADLTDNSKVSVFDELGMRLKNQQINWIFKFPLLIAAVDAPASRQKDTVFVTTDLKLS